MAQILLATLPQQQRQGVFQTPSASVVSAGTLVPGARFAEITISPVIDAPDFVDPANSLALRIYRLDPATSAWTVVGSMTWFGRVGADITNPDQYPLFSWSQPANWVTQDMRGEMDVPVRMRVGLRLEVLVV